MQIDFTFTRLNVKPSCMIQRFYWRQRIEQAWAKVPIACLAGVRRVGKTTLAKDMKDIVYFNCDLPSVVDRISDPESFFRSLQTPRVVLDEVHQLADPSRVLKIAADAFPHLRILATGSSTLAASSKFKDTLTGRKRIIHMLPVLEEELAAFGIEDIRKRLLLGGLPQASEPYERTFDGLKVTVTNAANLRQLLVGSYTNN